MSGKSERIIMPDEGIPQILPDLVDHIGNRMVEHHYESGRTFPSHDPPLPPDFRKQVLFHLFSPGTGPAARKIRE
jgi:hypothetical protein